MHIWLHWCPSIVLHRGREKGVAGMGSSPFCQESNYNFLIPVIWLVNSRHLKFCRIPLGMHASFDNRFGCYNLNRPDASAIGTVYLSDFRIPQIRCYRTLVLYTQVLYSNRFEGFYSLLIPLPHCPTCVQPWEYYACVCMLTDLYGYASWVHSHLLCGIWCQCLQ